MLDLTSFNLSCIRHKKISETFFVNNGLTKFYLTNDLLILDENYYDKKFLIIFENENFDDEDKNLFRKSLAFFNDEKREEQHKLKFNSSNLKFFIGLASGCESFSFRVTLKEYKTGLSASKYSLILNQFSIESNSFTAFINEILLNNFPLKLFDELFITDEDIVLKFQFLIVILDKSRTLSSTTKFLIIPKGFYFSHIISKLWFIFISLMFRKILHIFTKKLNIGLTLYLVIFYLFKMILFKFSTYVNIMKFYTCEEYEVDSIGYYYNFFDISFESFLVTNLSIRRRMRCFYRRRIKRLLFYQSCLKSLTTDLDLFYDKVFESESLSKVIIFDNYLFNETV